MIPKYLQDNQIPFSFEDDLPFSDYIANCKKLISTYRVDLANDKEKIIEANCPFEFYPASTPKAGALLIHGLLDSPFNMRDIGKRLQAEGLLVRGILLPGQGTCPGDLLNVKLESWIQAVRYGVMSLSKDVEKIYLVGFSTGASLALYTVLAKMFPEKLIQKIILLAPAIKIHSSLDFTTGWYPHLGKFWNRANWLHISKELDYVHYHSVTFNSAYQVYLLSQLIKKLSEKTRLSCPMLMIGTDADEIISPNAMVKYFNRYFKKENQMLLYSNKNSENDNIVTRDYRYPQFNILNLSHVGLPISPDNVYYGKNGEYVDASHIDEHNGTIYCSMDRGQEQFYDWLYRLKLIKHRRAQLSFNPDFDFMVKVILDFLK